jgi:hypothetical protein
MDTPCHSPITGDAPHGTPTSHSVSCQEDERINEMTMTDGIRLMLQLNPPPLVPLPFIAPPPDFYPHDIICGPGGGTNKNIANIKFRAMVDSYAILFKHSTNDEKTLLINEIRQKFITHWSPPARFWKPDDTNKEVWILLSEKEICKKIRQRVNDVLKAQKVDNVQSNSSVTQPQQVTPVVAAPMPTPASTLFQNVTIKIDIDGTRDPFMVCFMILAPRTDNFLNEVAQMIQCERELYHYHHNHHLMTNRTLPYTSSPPRGPILHRVSNDSTSPDHHQQQNTNVGMNRTDMHPPTFPDLSHLYCDINDNSSPASQSNLRQDASSDMSVSDDNLSANDNHDADHSVRSVETFSLSSIMIEQVSESNNNNSNKNNNNHKEATTSVTTVSNVCQTSCNILLDDNKGGRKPPSISTSTWIHNAIADQSELAVRNEQQYYPSSDKDTEMSFTSSLEGNSTNNAPACPIIPTQSIFWNPPSRFKQPFQKQEGKRNLLPSINETDSTLPDSHSNVTTKSVSNDSLKANFRRRQMLAIKEVCWFSQSDVSEITDLSTAFTSLTLDTFLSSSSDLN